MKCLSAIIPVSLLLVAATAMATPVPNLYTNVSNLTSSDTTTVTINNAGEATSFTTGVKASTLYAATLLLDTVSGPTLVVHPNAVVGYDAYIYSNASGAPGSLLYSLTGESAFSNKSLVTFPAPANSTLAADTTYWLVLKTAQTGYTGEWEATAVNSSTTPVDWSIPGGEVNLGGGSSANTPLFDIVVTPEPGTMALAGLGGLGLMIFRRRA